MLIDLYAEMIRGESHLKTVDVQAVRKLRRNRSETIGILHFSVGRL